MKKCDLFSTQVGFTYQGEDKFSTKCGRFVTLTVVIVFLLLFSIRFIEFIGGMDPIEYFSVREQDLDEVIDLQALGFSFAVQ